MSALYNKFEPFVEGLAHKLHDLESDQLTIALSNSSAFATPATVNVYEDLSEVSQISYANIGDAGGTKSYRNITTTSSSQVDGVYTLTLTDLTLDAVGTVADFQYVIIYNDTSTDDKLICWFDYGSTVSLSNGESFTIDFAVVGSGGLFTLE